MGDLVTVTTNQLWEGLCSRQEVAIGRGISIALVIHSFDHSYSRFVARIFNYRIRMFIQQGFDRIAALSAHGRMNERL